jgi:hypothetical protein
VIDSAKLTLYSNPTPLNGHDGNANTGPENALYIQRVTEEWVYNSVNWTNQPAATDVEQVSIPHTDEPFLDLIDVDVSELVKTMISTGSNHGFLIRLQNEVTYNFRVFCSSKYSDKTKRPQLQVYYH